VSVSYEATFPPTPQGVGAMRGEVAAFAQRAGLDEDGVSDVRLAV
jgi:anti-sigma regulatory factor (Ser/Thr protein kinase)